MNRLVVWLLSADVYCAGNKLMIGKTGLYVANLLMIMFMFPLTCIY